MDDWPRSVRAAAAVVVLAGCGGADVSPPGPRSVPLPERAPELVSGGHGGRGFDRVVTWRIHELPVLRSADEAVPIEAEDVFVDVARYREMGEASVHARVRVREAPLGLMEIAGQTGAQGGAYRDLALGTWVRCGAGPSSTTETAWWSALTPRAGATEVAIGEGWFLQAGCRVMLSRRLTATVHAASLSPPVLVFRAGDEPGHEPWMGLILPRATALVSDGIDRKDVHTGSFTFVRVPLVRGRSVSIVAAIAGLDTAAFEAALDLPARADMAGIATVDLEVSQAARDDAPIAVAYLTAGPRTEP